MWIKNNFFYGKVTFAVLVEVMRIKNNFFYGKVKYATEV